MTEQPGSEAGSLKSTDETSEETPRGAVVLLGILTAAALMPIVSVEYFFATDVPAHLHSAHLFAGLITGNTGPGLYVLNESVVPNSLGHWMMAMLLTVMSPAATSKVMAIATWAGFAASVPWLRYCVRGSKGLKLAVLLGAVLSYNFLWILGLYNFILGAGGCLFAVGLLFRWHGRLTWGRAGLFAMLASAVFFGHLIAFGVLVLAAGVHFVMNPREYRRDRVIMLALSFLPSAALLGAYQYAKVAEAAMAPRWLLAEFGLTLTGVANYLKQTDPLTLIGDHNVAPFVAGESVLLLLASPTLWFLFAVLLLAASTIRWIDRGWNAGGGRGYLVLTIVILALALAAPEDLGSTQGSILRPRLILMSAALFAAVFAVPKGLAARFACYVALGIPLAMQTASLWEYSLRYDPPAREILAAAEAIPAGDRLASVLVFRDDSKFHESAVKRIASVVGIAKDSVVWDNYETGYYFFPVVARSGDDRRFIREFSAVNTFRTRYAGERIDPAQVARFAELLDAAADRIDTLMVWGNDEQVDRVIAERFSPAAYYEKGPARLYKRSR